MIAKIFIGLACIGGFLFLMFVGWACWFVHHLIKEYGDIEEVRI